MRLSFPAEQRNATGRQAVAKGLVAYILGVIVLAFVVPLTMIDSRNKEMKGYYPKSSHIGQ